MASIRNLKKNVNYLLSDVIEYAYVWQIIHPEKSEKTESLIDDVIRKFDELIAKINTKKIEKPRKHFNEIKEGLNESVVKFHEQLRSF